MSPELAQEPGLGLAQGPVPGRAREPELVQEPGRALEPGLALALVPVSGLVLARVPERASFPGG